METNITVLGAGYVGLTTAALLANSGYKVWLVEPNEKRLQAVKSGKSFFYEKGLDKIIKPVIKNGWLVPTDSYKKSVGASKYIFSCVGTPDNPDGSSNLSYVFSAAKEAGKYLGSGAIYIQKSTVPVGTGKRVAELLPKNVEYVSNPEFLKEGTAIHDSLFFDRIVVGGKKAAADNVLGLYKLIERNRAKIAKLAGLNNSDTAGEYIKTNLSSAELIKVSANAFLALKISFANSIAMLADQTNADVTKVMDAVGADSRIGRAFLSAGRGYGGGCFPKDVSGLISSAKDHGIDLGIMTAASDLNDSLPAYIATKVQHALGGSLQGKKIAVLGLAFKPGTSDARRSPGVKLANILDKSRARVAVYDPQANSEAKPDLRTSIKLCQSLREACNNTDAVLVATDWPEFKNMDLGKLNCGVFVDCMNCFEPEKVKKRGSLYVGVGKS
jgi:UDPglucose 6-dehydrogenase